MKHLLKVATVAGLLMTGSAYAVEDGRSVGANGFALDGQSYFALPPPDGIWYTNYLGRQQADQFLDNHGRDTMKGAKATADLNVFRISYFPKTTLWGAEWGAFEIFPTYASSSFEYMGQKQSNSGLTDLAIDPFGLGWKLKTANIGFATTFVLPTGSYNQYRRVNIGRNFVSWTPQFFYTRFLKDNAGDISAHFGYEYNFSNNKGAVSSINPTGAKYKSGQMIHAEVAYSRHVGQHWALAGSLVGGYQFVDDKISGDATADDYLRNALDGNRYKGLSAGISVRYLMAGTAPVFLSYNKDIYARSKSKGYKFLLEFIMPLKQS